VPKYVPGEDNGSYIKIAEAPKRGEPVGEREPQFRLHIYICVSKAPKMSTWIPVEPTSR
jgi:hypothetical protein